MAERTIARQNINFQKLILIAGLILMAGKFAVYFVTHSNMVFTDALESIINVLAAAFALYSLHLSSIPRDSNHPYGHGKIEFLSATLEGALIFIAGAVIIIKSIYSLIYPQPIAKLEIGIGVILVTGVINFALGVYSIKKGKKFKNIVLEAEGKHLKADAWSSAGLVIGLIVIHFTHYTWLDSLISIIFGGLISVAGYKIMRTSVAGIMDEADYKLLREIVEVLNKNRRPEWIDIHNLRVIKYGSTLHIDCHLTVPWYLTVEEAHKEVDSIEKLIDSNFENNIEVFIHVDPCEKFSCTICGKPECAHRMQKQEKVVDWTFENVLENKKHGT
jgi:cation diffusion facilitator family transporter